MISEMFILNLLHQILTTYYLLWSRCVCVCMTSGYIMTTCSMLSIKDTCRISVQYLYYCEICGHVMAMIITSYSQTQSFTSNIVVSGIVMWLAATRSPTTNHMSTSIWFREIKNYYSLKTNISPANCWLEDDSFPFNISLLRRQVHLHGGTSPRHEQKLLRHP